MLTVARPDQIEAIHRESHVLWGAGLDPVQYSEMWAELRSVPWARKHFTHYVWLDPTGAILSSVKLYRPLLRVRGRVGRAAAIGAVFTPHSRRNLGYARAMLRALVAEAKERGDTAALLFSDIGSDYYAQMGFRPLPAEEAFGVLPRKRARAPSGWKLRAMTREDLDAVNRAHEVSCRGREVAMLRDREHWEFLMARAAGFFTRLDGSDISRRYCVAIRDGTLAGYLVSADGEGEWNVREVGAIDGDDDAIRAILQVGAAHARDAGMLGVYGWFPRPVADLVPEWGLRFETRQRAVPMLLPLLDDLDGRTLQAASASFVPYLDQF
jgi:predicted N-acetyltransferase YhbS